MKIKPEKEFYHCFEAGDLVGNQHGNFVVIAEVKNGEYKFINLQSQSIHVIGDVLNIAKGSISSQPCSILDKHYYLHQIKK